MQMADVSPIPDRLFFDWTRTKVILSCVSRCSKRFQPTPSAAKPRGWTLKASVSPRAFSEGFERRRSKRLIRNLHQVSAEAKKGTDVHKSWRCRRCRTMSGRLWTWRHRSARQQTDDTVLMHLPACLPASCYISVVRPRLRFTVRGPRSIDHHRPARVCVLSIP